MGEKNMSDKKPMILVFAGPNGSGKSTITQYFEIVGTYTNADEIVAATGMNNQDAAEFVDRNRYESIAAGADFTFETVLSSRYKLEILRKAQEAGFFIKCVFVLTVNPEVNVARVETRVAAGGHDVEKNKIIERYYKALANIPELMNLCDIMHIYDNTDSTFRIVRKHKDQITLFPNEFWPMEKIEKLIGK